MKLEKIIQQFTNKKILVIGDIMLDEYIWGNVERISPEAPVPIMEVTRESQTLGASANVVHNIYCLKGIPLLVGVVGADAQGEKLKEILETKRMDTSGIFVDSTRRTTTKTRLVVERPHQQLVRVDREEKIAISSSLQNKILEFVRSQGKKFDAILFEDYDKGTLSGWLISRIIHSFRDKIITADPKIDNFFEYKNLTLFKPNRKEVERAMGVKLTPKNVKSVARNLREKLKCKSLLLTLGDEGMVLSLAGKKHIIPTRAREVYDVAGAGDTVIAIATIALACGASPKESATLANMAAGIEVRKIGAVPVTYDELLSAVKDEKTH